MSKKYTIELKSSLEHDLKSIDRQYISKIIQAIENLADEPFSTSSRKILGSRSSYRLRVGDYRIIYQVDSEKGLVTVYHVRHRKEAYKKLY